MNKEYDLEALRSLAPSLAGTSDQAILAALKRFAELEREAQLARQKRGIRRKLESGEGYGAAPVGYVNRRKGGRAWIEPDPLTYPLVQEAKHLHATGNYSLRKLCVVMAEKGLRSRNGKVMGLSAMRWMLDHSPVALNSRCLIGFEQ